MPVHTEFNWSEQVEIDDEIFSADCLNRARYADFITSFLISLDQNKPYVMNLNAEWGSGKTYFLKRWKYDLMKIHPVIYIDVWKNDYSDDPLMSVVSSVVSQLREKTDKNESSVFTRGYDFSSSLIKQVAPIIAGGLAKKYIGVALDEISLNKDDGLTSPNSDSKIDLAAQKITSLLMSEHEKKAASISSLKKTMKQWIDAVIGQDRGNFKLEHPTIIIIDELDRCRPSHAVETLEVVKHIFDIPGVFFVIATDTEQLQHAIKAVYGNDFDAQTYLSRFFDSRFTLPVASLERSIVSHCDSSVLDIASLSERNIRIWPVNSNHIENIVAILDAFNITARSAIQIFQRIVSVVRFLKHGDSIDLIYLTTLFCFQAKHNRIYQDIIDGKKVGSHGYFINNCAGMASKKLFKVNVITLQVEGDKIFDIELAQYYTQIFPQYSGAVEGINRMILDKREDKHAIQRSIMSKFLNISGGYGEENIQRDLLNISYRNYEMYFVERDKYRNLVELAVSFD